MRRILVSAVSMTIAVAGCGLSAPTPAGGAGGSQTTGSGGDTSHPAGTGGIVGGLGGNTATGFGGTGTGGTTGGGGVTGAGGTVTGTGGVVGGTGGAAVDLKTAAAALDGLRLDDVCGTLQSNAVCLHVVNNDALPYTASKSAMMGGTAGTVYQVKFHIRGITETTHVQGGTTGTPVNFNTGGTVFADSAPEGAYEQWQIIVPNPSQHYFVNAFNAASLVHQVRLLDFQETIPIAAGATVTVQVHDGNGHLISNTNAPILVPTGTPTIPGSMNSGQFVELNVDAVTLN